MTFTEQDLRDALQPLAGDPVQDASRVLDALPKPPLPPVTWWLSGAGLLAGVLLGGLLGWVAGLGSGGATVPVEPRDERATQETEPQKQEEQRPQEDKPGVRMPMEMEIYLMAFGELTVNEPGIGRQVLHPDSYGLVMGSSIETSQESRAGVHVPSDDVVLRLDHETVATIAAPREIRLARGRIFVQTGMHGGEVRVMASMGETVLDDGAMQVTAWPGLLTVLVLDGMATIRTEAGETRRLEGKQELVADRDGVRLREVPFLGTATSWMTEMIRLQQDDAELRARVVSMVEAYQEGTWRDAAEQEIRKLGSNCVALLAYSIGPRGVDDAEYRARTADLVASIANYRTAGWLLPLLGHDDPVVRLRVFRGLRRITNEEAGGTEEFWRNASPGDRQQGIARWREVLGGR